MPWDPVCVLDLLLRERITQFDLDLGFLSPGGAVLQNIEDVSPAVDVESVLELGEIAPPDLRNDDAGTQRFISTSRRFSYRRSAGVQLKDSVSAALEGRDPSLQGLQETWVPLTIIPINAVRAVWRIRETSP